MPIAQQKGHKKKELVLDQMIQAGITTDSSTNFKIFSSISSDKIPPRSPCQCSHNLYQSVAIHMQYVLLVLLLHLLKYLGI